MAGDEICSLEISFVQSMQLRSDLIVSENTTAELCWRSLQEASNVDGESDSSVIREVMSGPMSLSWNRTPKHLISGDVGLDESGLDLSSWMLALR